MLVAALDGFDTQAIGYTAPAIAAVIHLPMPQFGQVGSAGLVGAAIGALSFGPLADIFGRKWFMIIAVAVFAVFSYLTSTSTSLEQLLACRFCCLRAGVEVRIAPPHCKRAIGDRRGAGARRERDRRRFCFPSGDRRRD